VKVQWPFPLILVVDICGTNDLDLNSSKTEIILSDKWLQFEELLAYIICNEISKQVEKDFWDAFKDVITKATTEETFLRGVNKVKKL